MTAPAEATKKPSRWEDFIDIFYAPADVYRRRESSSFWPPLLFVTIMLTVFAFVNAGVLQPVYDAVFERQAETMMQQNPQLSLADVERMRGFTEISMRYGAIVIVPIAITVVALVSWLIGKLFGAALGFAAAMMVAAYAYVPRVLEQAVDSAQGLLLDPERMTGLHSLKIGPSRFLDPDESSRVLMAVLDRLDLFTVWTTVLIGVGLYVVGKLAKERAAIAATIVWVLGGLFGILGALRAP